MVYTPVPSKAPNDVITAAIWNTYIRDNFAAGVPDLFTTKGDIVVANAADTAGRLGVGAAGNVLRINAAAALGLEWNTLSKITYPVRALRGAVQSIASAPPAVLVQFDTEDFDPEGVFTLGAAAKYTAPVTGYYFVQANAVFATSSDFDINEICWLEVFKDGALDIILGRIEMQGSPTNWAMNVNGSGMVQLNAGQFIDIQLYQTSGMAINVQPVYVSVHRVG